MLSRIAVIAVCIVAAMVAVKNGRMLHTAGLTGSCRLVSTSPDGSELDACKGGKLAGRPDLTKRGCTSAGISGGYGYWRCPAGLQPTDAGR
jgi:hypothetical protein